MTRLGPIVPGLDSDLAAKVSIKSSDPEMEAMVRQWFNDVLKEPLPSCSLYEALKDGTYLCRLAKTVCPDMNINISNSKLPFKQMENINSFLNVAKKLGIPEYELFQTIDLYEDKNMYQVMLCILAFSRHAQKKGYGGSFSFIGPKLADKHEIHFTDEQLLKSKAEVGLQYGYTGGANQSGMCLGKRREVAENAIDPNADTI